VLSEVIVQILAQPPPFTIRDSRDLLIEPASLSHLAFERCGPFIHAPIKFANKRS
jgi:hypothetical protein